MGARAADEQASFTYYDFTTLLTTRADDEQASVTQQDSGPLTFYLPQQAKACHTVTLLISLFLLLRQNPEEEDTQF
jgi:hypothetical protein